MIQLEDLLEKLIIDGIQPNETDMYVNAYLGENPTVFAWTGTIRSGKSSGTVVTDQFAFVLRSRLM